MSGGAWLLMVAAAAGWASTSRQPLPSALVEVDARGQWSPPPGAGPAADSLLFPVWTRQNLWRPWTQWIASPPRFDSTMAEAALVMATGVRRTGSPDDIPDLYRENPDGSPRPFDPGHPFFHLLKRLKAAGIKPVIDLGPPPEALCGRGKVPRKGAFDFHVEAPRDSAAYERYFGFIRDLFAYLQGPGMFSRAEVASWRYQLHREPDNRDAFDPAGEGKHMDPRNLEEYKRLYDYTVAGMRASGVETALALGNLAVPHDGIYGLTGTWAAPLMDWLASGAPSRCPHLKGPRLRAGDTLYFSFSAYALSQMSLDPRDLGPMVRKVRGLALQRFPRNPVLITVGEGNIHYDDDSHRGDATELGAAWNAALVKIAHDEGLHRFQQWGFTSAPHISLFEEHGGLKPPAYNVLRMYRMMQGGRLIPARAGQPQGPMAKAGAGPGKAAGPYVDAIAVRRAGGEVMVLCFRFDADREARDGGPVMVTVKGLPPSRPCAVTEYRVDRDHGNYYTLWRRDNGARPLARGKYDALMEYQFTPEQKALWEANRERYRTATALVPTDPGSAHAATAADGSYSLRIDLPPNSVALLRVAFP